MSIYRSVLFTTYLPTYLFIHLSIPHQSNLLSHQSIYLQKYGCMLAGILCMYVCVHACISVNCKLGCMHACMHACMHGCTHPCMHMYVGACVCL